ncbi:Hypothetical protein A7982_05665 [Minicystis rosea]|nr:Hypothetical protein A7982_05665 [Minicystis rosea]
MRACAAWERRLFDCTTRGIPFGGDRRSLENPGRIHVEAQVPLERASVLTIRRPMRNARFGRIAAGPARPRDQGRLVRPHRDRWTADEIACRSCS